MAAVTNRKTIECSWVVLEPAELKFSGGTTLYDHTERGVIEIESEIVYGALEEWITIGGTVVLFDPPVNFSSDEVKEIMVHDEYQGDSLLFSFTLSNDRTQLWKVDTSQRREESNLPKTEVAKRPLPQSAWKVPAESSPTYKVKSSFNAVLVR